MISSDGVGASPSKSSHLLQVGSKAFFPLEMDKKCVVPLKGFSTKAALHLQDFLVVKGTRAKREIRRRLGGDHLKCIVFPAEILFFEPLLNLCFLLASTVAVRDAIFSEDDIVQKDVSFPHVDRGKMDP